MRSKVAGQLEVLMKDESCCGVALRNSEFVVSEFVVGGAVTHSLVERRNTSCTSDTLHSQGVAFVVFRRQVIA